MTIREPSHQIVALFAVQTPKKIGFDPRLAASTEKWSIARMIYRFWLGKRREMTFDNAEVMIITFVIISLMVF
jgi:hypothetical protein